MPRVRDAANLVLYVPKQNLRPTSTRTRELVDQLPRGIEKHSGNGVDIQHLVHLRVTVEIDLVEHCSRAGEGVSLCQKAEAVSQVVAGPAPGHVCHHRHELAGQRLVHRIQKPWNPLRDRRNISVVINTTVRVLPERRSRAAWPRYPGRRRSQSAPSRCPTISASAPKGRGLGRAVGTFRGGRGEEVGGEAGRRRRKRRGRKRRRPRLRKKRTRTKRGRRTRTRRRRRRGEGRWGRGGGRGEGRGGGGGGGGGQQVGLLTKEVLSPGVRISLVTLVHKQCAMRKREVRRPHRVNTTEVSGKEGGSPEIKAGHIGCFKVYARYSIEHRPNCISTPSFWVLGERVLPLARYFRRSLLQFPAYLAHNIIFSLPTMTPTGVPTIPPTTVSDYQASEWTASFDSSDPTQTTQEKQE